MYGESKEAVCWRRCRTKSICDSRIWYAPTCGIRYGMSAHIICTTTSRRH